MTSGSLGKADLWHLAQPLSKIPMNALAAPLHTPYDGDLTNCKLSWNLPVLLWAHRQHLTPSPPSWGNRPVLKSAGLQAGQAQVRHCFCCQSQREHRQDEGSEVSAPHRVVLSLGLAENDLRQSQKGSQRLLHLVPLRVSCWPRGLHAVR